MKLNCSQLVDFSGLGWEERGACLGKEEWEEEKEGETGKREVYGGEGDIQMEVILTKRDDRRGILLRAGFTVQSGIHFTPVKCFSEETAPAVSQCGVHVSDSKTHCSI